MAAMKRKADTAAVFDSKKPKTDSAITSFFGAPKPTSTPSSAKAASSVESAPMTKFNKDKWVATLSDEQKKLLKLEIDTLDESWLSHLKEHIITPEFLNLKRFLQKEIDSGKKIYPPLEDVYSWSRHTPLHTVKAVILGQDPYHGPSQAHGLCFSVRPPTPAPPSLKNMYIALARDYPSFKPPPNRGGLLTPWAQQGVLMLNTCLTVEGGIANSHQKKGWEGFTQKVIDTVVKSRSRGVVFLAWGTPAQGRCKGVSGKHLVLKSVHPSPLSAARGFFECAHFRKTNEFLERVYGAEGTIDWSLDKKVDAKAPAVAKKGAVKVTADAKKSGSEPSVLAGHQDKAAEDEFDDEDAMRAMEELADSSVIAEEPASSAPAPAAPTGTPQKAETFDDADAVEAMEELASDAAAATDDQGTKNVEDDAAATLKKADDIAPKIANGEFLGAK